MSELSSIDALTGREATAICPAAIPHRKDALAVLTATRAGRWLVPSLSDLFFLALFVWLFLAGNYGWKGLLGDGDIGWHIRTGDYILSHHAVPQTDLFSFTRPDAPWFAWEWLSDVLFAIVHQWAGLKGVVLLAGTVIMCWPLLLLRQALWRGANGWAALVTTLLAVGSGSIHFLARPHVFTLVFTAVAVWLIEADRRLPSRRLWILVPLTALWTNLHGGFVLMVVLAGLAAAGSLAEAWAGCVPYRRAVRYAVLALASAAASLVNPYGVRLHIHIIEYLRSDWIRSVVQEFQAPSFRSENLLQYEVLLLSGVALTGVLIVRRRFVHALWLIALAHFSLSSVRHVPLYVTIAAPLVAEMLSGIWSDWAARSGRASTLRILDRLGTEVAIGFRRTSLWVPAFLFVLPLTGGVNWPRDFPAELFPIALIHANQPALLSGRVLTVDQWADYLIYLGYPQQKVFADGRSDFFGPEVGGEYLGASSASRRWRGTLERYGVDTVLAPESWPLTSVLASEPGWRVVAQDDRAVLLRKRVPGPLVPQVLAHIPGIPSDVYSVRQIDRYRTTGSKENRQLYGGARGKP